MKNKKMPGYNQQMLSKLNVLEEVQMNNIQGGLESSYTQSGGNYSLRGDFTDGGGSGWNWSLVGADAGMILAGAALAVCAPCDAIVIIGAVVATGAAIYENYKEFYPVSTPVITTNITYYMP